MRNNWSRVRELERMRRHAMPSAKQREWLNAIAERLGVVAA
jgi:hypothetical protein